MTSWKSGIRRPIALPEEFGLQFAATLLNLMENWLRLLFSRDALRLNDRVATLAETGPE
jgi:hypothetical protein